MRTQASIKYVWIVLTVSLCSAVGAAGQTTETRDTIRSTQTAELLPFPEPKPADDRNSSKLILNHPVAPKFQWRPAIREAWFYTGAMHVFRFATEAGTRDALTGPWMKNYQDSVKALRGWDDGDSFVTSYVAHPMEGAVFGYIQQHNDPQYRRIEWGDGRAYWRGRLRALGFSAVWSTQWTLGPASEASLGNVQIHESPGFVDLVGTPILGVGLMIGEDIADRYLIVGLENHTPNRAVLLLARSFLNPTRAFANLMAFKEPWLRESRIGLFKENYARRKQLVGEYKAGGEKPFTFVKSEPNDDLSLYPLLAPIEITASAQSENFFGHGTCAGGGGEGAVRLTPAWQIVAEVNGCMLIDMPKNESGDSLSYLIGPRWTPRASKRLSPYVQLLLGGRRITHETDDPAKRKELMDGWNKGTLPHYPMRRDWAVENQANGFAMAMGGGLDVVMNSALSWRVARLEYTHAWLPDVDQIHASDGAQFTSGVILRIGSW